ncbi:MAG: plastocyanin/azurin family copper-binding protein [Nitriliruptoraceae bacterium]
MSTAVRTGVSRRLLAGAATVLALSGCAGGGTVASSATDAADGSLRVEAGDMYFEPQRLAAAPGEVELTLDNVGGVVHDLVIEEAGDAQVVVANPGEVVTGSIELEAGTYTYYCSVPGHREAMQGTLEVTP